MKLEIFYTRHYRTASAAIYDFIEKNVGKKDADKFLIRIEKVLNLIATNPYMFKSSNFDKSVRVGLINKQHSFLYKVSENNIYILFIWDNKQEPLF